eukprot:Gregarina_sp_Pseudo_9__1187@NODE_1782_length_1333_cov_315_089645_g1651_i0_p1_GENE_NODE_1782_length_1333_cov_315_089645_g1651_i0NODE_1782_length_1333_cov_315_089645_g1651_i0_p1_ORF_typecomplete_len364_score33_59DUF5045/PF16464_5/0_14_NODE_1782_length_1333_cov_315_089645_g1651_i0611092
MSTLLSSTGSPPPSAVAESESKIGASTPTVASNTDAPVEAAPTEAASKPKKQQPSNPPRASPGSDLKGSIALSVVASSHASLNEALKRLRLEFESIRSSGVACNKALSTIDSLLIESESLLKDLISRSGESGTEASKKRRANAKRSGRRASAKKDESKSAAEDGMNAVGGSSTKEPQLQIATADSPRRSGPLSNRNQPKRLPLLFGNERSLRGPPMYYQASPSRQVFRVDETMMQYRSPQYYSLMTDNRFQGASAALPTMARKARPASFGRERDRDAAKKNRLLVREKEEAALRNELRNATTIQQFTDLMDKANKMGMQFEVAAVNNRVAKLQAATDACSQST